MCEPPDQSPPNFAQTSTTTRGRFLTQVWPAPPTQPMDPWVPQAPKMSFILSRFFFIVNQSYYHFDGFKKWTSGSCSPFFILFQKFDGLTNFIASWLRLRTFLTLRSHYKITFSYTLIISGLNPSLKACDESKHIRENRVQTFLLIYWTNVFDT